MHFDFIPAAVAEVIGIAGFCLYVLTYSLLTLRILPSQTVTYFSMNLTASSCVLIGLTASFNLPAALIQIFWVTMSVIGITLQLTRGRKRRSEPRHSPAHHVDA